MQTNRPKNHSARADGSACLISCYRRNGARIPVIGDGGRIQRRPLRCLRDRRFRRDLVVPLYGRFHVDRMEHDRAGKRCLHCRGRIQGLRLRPRHGRHYAGRDRCTGRVAHQLLQPGERRVHWSRQQGQRLCICSGLRCRRRRQGCGNVRHVLLGLHYQVRFDVPLAAFDQTPTRSAPGSSARTGRTVLATPPQPTSTK